MIRRLICLFWYRGHDPEYAYAPKGTGLKSICSRCGKTWRK